jgi:hypothetical protein
LIFQEAVERYKQKLATGDKQYLLSVGDVSVAKLIESVGRFDREHKQRSCTRKGFTHVQGFLEVVDGYLKSISIIIQSSPEISSLVISRLKLFVDVGNLYDYPPT